MSKRRTFIGGSNESIVFKDDDFDTNVRKFKRHLNAKNRSTYTIKSYTEQFTKFKKVLQEQGYATRLQRISEETITEGFIGYLQNVKELEYNSITVGLRSLRAFFNWSVKQGVIDSSPMQGVTIGKANNDAVETFNDDQLDDLFNQPNLDSFVGLRDYAIMSVFLETGVRLRELVDIKVNDIRTEDSQILIRGKNGKDRLVPVQDRCKRVLKRFMEVRGRINTDYAFITHDDTKLSRKAVQERISIYGRRANILNVRCSPHTFRHTFAKLSVKNGANIFELQAILGHSTLDMVRIYVNLFSDDIYESHKRFSPLENLR